MWEINEKLLEMINTENISIEYTSLYSENNGYSCGLIKGKKYIIVPTEPSQPYLVRQWAVAHELGHFLLEKEYDVFTLSTYEIERIAWYKAKEVLEQCKIALKVDTCSFAEIMDGNLITYSQCNSKNQKKIKYCKHIIISWADFVSGFLKCINGVICTYFALIGVYGILVAIGHSESLNQLTSTVFIIFVINIILKCIISKF